MRTILFILSFGFSMVGFSQIIGTHYFNDTLNGKLNQIHDYIEVADGIIVSGEMNINNVEYPVVIKLSPQGELIWSTINTAMYGTLYNCIRFNIYLFDDGFIYGTTYFGSGANVNRIWKINPQDGSVVYSTQFHSNFAAEMKLEEYDTSKFIVTYEKETLGIQYSMLAYLNKANGDTLSTKTMSANPQFQEGARVDEDKNVYFWSGNKFMKFNKGNLNEKLWERTYQTGLTNPLDFIQDVYLDQEDRVFLFGIDGGTFGHGDGNVLEVSPVDGIPYWDTQALPAQVKIKNIIDREGKLYLCYQHSLVGSTFTRYFASRIDKFTGSRDWYCAHSMTPVGTPVPMQSSNMQGALSMDLDCSGGLYMTGYYGDANYGPEMWGVMKVNASTGAKIYDFTVTEDSVYYDDFSSGKVICVFENSPVVLGHLENLNSPNLWLSDAYYVAFDPQNGTILDRHGISGQLQLQSKTIDLVRKDNEIFVFKQHGKYLAVQSMNPDFTTNWSTPIIDTSYLQGGQMTVTPNYIYVTAHMNYSTGSYPFDLGIAFRYFVYRINRQTGAITHSTYIPLLTGTIAPMEIEADDDQFFFYYRRNSSEYVRRWTVSTGYSNEYAVNLAGATTEFDGEHNNVLNYTTNSLIVIGSDAIRLVPKTAMASPTVLFNFSGTRSYYDCKLFDDKIYMVGKNNAGSKLITVYDISGDSIIWEQNYGLGTWLKIDKDPYNNFIVGGEHDSLMNLTMVKRIDGSVIWEKYIDTLAHPATHLLDCRVNQSANIISLTGARYNANGSTDVILSIYNFYGDTLFTYLGEDVQDLKSTGFTIEVAPDSTTWIGGAYNRLISVKEGFIFRVGTDYCERYIAGDSISCSGTNALLTAWPGTNYQWYQNGTLVSGAISQTYSPTSSGFYNVMVSDACSQDSLVYPFEYSSIEIPNVILYGGAGFCTGDSIQLSTPSLSSYQWYLNGTPVPNEVFNTIYTDTDGTYNVLVTNNFGCADSANVGLNVVEFPSPNINFEISTDFLCENDASLELTASPLGGIFSGSGVSTNQFNPSTPGEGIYNLTYTYTDDNGCMGTKIDTIRVEGTTNSTLTISALDSYTLNGQTYTTAGSYQQVVSNANGCDSIITLNLTLNFTGLNEHFLIADVQPNPSNGLFELQFATVPTNELLVYNSKGRLIKIQSVQTTTTILDLIGQASGVYFLHVSGNVIRLIIE